MADNLTPGARRGKWTLASYTPAVWKAVPRVYATWLCACDCGTQRKVRVEALTSGASRSCGCERAKAKSRAIGDALSTVVSRRPML